MPWYTYSSDYVSTSRQKIVYEIHNSVDTISKPWPWIVHCGLVVKCTNFSWIVGFLLGVHMCWRGWPSCHENWQCQCTADKQASLLHLCIDTDSHNVHKQSPHTKIVALQHTLNRKTVRLYNGLKCNGTVMQCTDFTFNIGEWNETTSHAFQKPGSLGVWEWY